VLAMEYSMDQGLALESTLKHTEMGKNGTIWIFFESFDCMIYCNALCTSDYST
jgi:hypothetical protein